jgi:hypothetical protein
VVTNADWRETDWQAIAIELDAQGCARTPRLLAPAQCRDLAALYDKPELFRSTIDLLVIARDWAGRPSRPAPWPDTLAAWMEMCHRAGQGKSAQILLRYQAGDWNALHRGVFGDLVFPLQVVVGLDQYGTDYGMPSAWSSTTPEPGLAAEKLCVSCLRGRPGAGDLLGLDLLGRVCVYLCLSVCV